jgi:hypothetical protein
MPQSVNRKVKLGHYQTIGSRLLSDYRFTQALAPLSVLPSIGLKHAIEMEFDDLRVDCFHGAVRLFRL